MKPRFVHRHVIPVDDAWHTFDLTGPVVHVDCRDAREVEIWTLHNEGEVGRLQSFRVFATGQKLPPESGQHIGTALSPASPPFTLRGAFVWHLFEGQLPAGVS